MTDDLTETSPDTTAAEDARAERLLALAKAWGKVVAAALCGYLWGWLAAAVVGLVWAGLKGGWRDVRDFTDSGDGI